LASSASRSKAASLGLGEVRKSSATDATELKTVLYFFGFETRKPALNAIPSAPEIVVSGRARERNFPHLAAAWAGYGFSPFNAVGHSFIQSALTEPRKATMKPPRCSFETGVPRGPERGG
jgi:hypothetical protein